MIFLFLIFALVVVLIFYGYRDLAIVLTLLNLLLMVLMFWHHVTSAVSIQL